MMLKKVFGANSVPLRTRRTLAARPISVWPGLRKNRKGSVTGTLILAAVLLSLAMTTSSCTTASDSARSKPIPKLLPCSDSPNCVSSDSPPGSHFVAPLVIEGSPKVAWATLVEKVSKWPRTEIVSEGKDALSLECRSSFFRFVDDVQVQLRASEGVIAVRSASRVGYTDFGVNRSRVEELRSELQKAGVVR